MNKARIGFIGAGAHISAQHRPNAHASPHMRVHAICDLNGELLARHERTYAPAYVTTDYRKILADPDVHIVVIGTKQDLHARLAIEALRAGKWAYVEKPVGETIEELREIVRVERNSEAKLAVGHNRRFAPAIQDAWRLLDQQSGPLFYYHRVVNRAPEMKGGFYTTREQLVWEGGHMFDLANYLTRSRAVAVISSGEPLRNNITTVEYADGSRFCLLLAEMGSPMKVGSARWSISSPAIWQATPLKPRRDTMAQWQRILR